MSYTKNAKTFTQSKNATAEVAVYIYVLGGAGRGEGVGATLYFNTSSVRVILL